MRLRTYFTAWLVLGILWSGPRPVLADALIPPHHEIVLHADPASGNIRVLDRITISGRRAVTLEIAPWMRINSVRIDGNSQSGDGATLDADALTLPSSGQHRIDIAAEGKIPPRKKVMNSPQSDAKPYAGSDGFFLPGWTNWVPDMSTGRASYEVTVQTPSAIRVAATGRLVSETLGKQENRAVFSLPASPEPPSIFAGSYEVAEKPGGSTRIRTYFHASAANLASSYLDAAERFTKRYSEKIGAYPYADFQIVSAPLPVGLGFPNLTYIDARILPLPFMRGRSLAHEILHNWWGNGVYADTARGNWSEGLTTYMADHDLADEGDPKKAAEMRLGWLRDYAALPKERDIPVTAFRAKRHDASQVIGYGKVAFIFHMLKREIGEARFDDAIRRVWRQHKHRTAGWRDLRAAFESAARTDLGWFFDQWTGRAGAPSLSLEGARSLQDGDGFSLQIALAQSPPTYRLKVPVEVTTRSGVHRSDVRFDGARWTATLKLDAAPISMRIDPDHSIFRQLAPGEAPPILRDILLDRFAKLIVLGDEPEFRTAARKLAGRLFDSGPDIVRPGSSGLPKSALLVIGSTDEITRFIADFGLQERPEALPGAGGARAWTARRKGGTAILFVEAAAAEVLEALSRPLPHYRSKSYIIFEGGRAVAHGVWPATTGPLVMIFN